MTWPPSGVTILGNTIGRPPQRTFGIRQRDRLFHQLILGKSGTGKSTLAENMITQDIIAGRGCCLLDPNGDLVSRIAANIPEHRKADLVHIDVPQVHQVHHVLGYNPLRHVRTSKRPLAAAGLLEVFKKLWSDSWGVRLEYILRNAIITLLDVPGSNLGDILKLLTDEAFRRSCIEKMENEHVKHFWNEEYGKWSEAFRMNAIAPIQNKVGAFLSDPSIKRILTSPDTDLSFRQIMDQKKILLVNLSKGQIGEDATRLLGGLLVTSISLAAYSRADVPERQRLPFYLYLDEFQNFTTLSVVNMASELRKFACGMVCVSQHLSQLDAEVKESVIGNCGTIICFRLGGKDAAVMAKEFAPVFASQDLVSLPNYRAYLRLMIDGTPSRPFSVQTIPPEVKMD